MSEARTAWTMYVKDCQKQQGLTYAQALAFASKLYTSEVKEQYLARARRAEAGSVVLEPEKKPRKTRSDKKVPEATPVKKKVKVDRTRVAELEAQLLRMELEQLKARDKKLSTRKAKKVVVVESSDDDSEDDYVSDDE